jgi:DNA-binding NarL/FixJ family response regulator
MKKAAILVADDHSILCQGLKAMLENQGVYEVVAEAKDGFEAVRLCQEHKPDLILLDIMMPGLNGIEVTRQVHREQPGCKIVILSMHSNEAYVAAAFKNGASGYVLKDATSGELLKAITEVLGGGRYISAPFTPQTLDAYKEMAKGKSLDLWDTLTPREREIALWVAKGLTNAEISNQLSTSQRTVEAHRSNLMHKLGLRTSADLVRFAMTRGKIADKD